MSTSSPTSAPLPRLRGDVTLEVVAERGNAFPSVIVTDPVRGSYFRLSWPQSGAILLWSDVNTAAELAARAQHKYGLALQSSDISAIVEFVFANQLSEVDSQGSWHHYASVFATARGGWLISLAHNYLFFRVPLLHPDAALKRIAPRVGFAFRPAFWIGLGLMALLAMHLAVRQWTNLVAEAHSAVALDGLLGYAVALLLLKAVHEFGHAITAARYGCTVPSMGAAFMLGAPVLYTDTSDSWRLSKRSERLTIVFAGVAAELVVAVLALLMWVFLDDGVARSLCFALATGAVAMSVLVNLNPFMRFDGYFGLSDLWETPNLQSRAFDLGVWQLRELLFNFGIAPPEALAPTRRRSLIVYAYATWAYRLVLYLGIVAVVYAIAGKAIGILLALFELVVFIGRPLAAEIGTWWGMRHQIRRSRRARWTGAACAAAMTLFVVPWLGTVDMPAVMAPEREEALHVAAPAELTYVSSVAGLRVSAGDVLFAARSPELERQLQKARLIEAKLVVQQRRLHASDREREHHVVLEMQLSETRERIAGLQRLAEQLRITAPFDGYLVDVDPGLSPGVWIGPKHQLGRVVSLKSSVARALIAEEDAGRIAPGAVGTFIPDDPSQPRLEMVLDTVAKSSDGRMPDDVLASKFGGPVVTDEQHAEHRTRHGWVEARLSSTTRHPGQLQRGIIKVDADRLSPAWLVWQKIGKVLAREQSF